ncbi:PREDICTED: glutathione S-transferase T3-like [Brassica oleracea var. oleracea]|uniref:glutathione S-transferase T3-like n=1 Tax=Brassica oleracea var. oleracea TaxID=109376 RepID=UPI0006A6C37A|nr:PREDICTED: glutathione S-transferase T3-like [Brassica oleracea var. oleracea]
MTRGELGTPRNIFLYWLRLYQTKWVEGDVNKVTQPVHRQANTTKDPVVGNEQKVGAFWKRIVDYYGASPKVGGGDKPEPMQCKQRWQKLNDLVCKFCGCYAAATRQKTSGQNEADTVKLAHEIFYNDHKIKFNLHQAWEELRNDHKWCEAATRKIDQTGKKRKCDDGAQSESSQAPADLGEESPRPPGGKAAKGAAGKRSIADQEAGKGAAHFQTMWSIKEKDLAIKKKLKKMGLLDSLISKKEPLSEFEDALKKKLLTEMLNL